MKKNEEMWLQNGKKTEGNPSLLSAIAGVTVSNTSKLFFLFGVYCFFMSCRLQSRTSSPVHGTDTGLTAIANPSTVLPCHSWSFKTRHLHARQATHSCLAHEAHNQDKWSGPPPMWDQTHVWRDCTCPWRSGLLFST